MQGAGLYAQNRLTEHLGNFGISNTASPPIQNFCLLLFELGFGDDSLLS